MVKMCSKWVYAAKVWHYVYRRGWYAGFVQTDTNRLRQEEKPFFFSLGGPIRFIDRTIWRTDSCSRLQIQRRPPL